MGVAGASGYPLAGHALSGRPFRRFVTTWCEKCGLSAHGLSDFDGKLFDNIEIEPFQSHHLLGVIG